MARGAIQYTSGNIPAGSSNIDAIVQAIRTQIKAYAGNAWVDGDIRNETPGALDYVMHSVGDVALGSGGNKGDTEIWIRIKRSSDAIQLYCYHDWSATSHTGTRESTNGLLSSFSNTAEIDWWCVCNEYGFLFVMVQSAIWRAFHVGCLIRPFATTLNGVARLSSATSGTGNVTLSVDRDISANIQVGQKIWLVNHTPDGENLKSDYCELVPVTAKTSNTISVSGVVNTPYAIGSLVGLDPCPVFIYSGTTLQGGAGTYYLCSNRDGTFTGSQSQYGTPYLVAPFTMAYERPDVDGMYVGVPCMFSMGTGTNCTGYRGLIGNHLLFFAAGTQTDRDLMRIDFNDSLKYIVFATLSGGPSSVWTPCIGPGAS